MTPARILVLMGVSGCGKSTIGGLLAERLGWPLEEGDDLHTPASLAKMAAGEPLDDDDRRPWLARIRAWIEQQEARDQPGIVTCSALRRRYRDVLRDEQVVFIHLHGSRETLLGRLGARQGHFMPAALLDSQLETLEPPGEDERAIRIDIGATPAAQASTILERLCLTP